VLSVSFDSLCSPLRGRLRRSISLRSIAVNPPPLSHMPETTERFEDSADLGGAFGAVAAEAGGELGGAGGGLGAWQNGLQRRLIGWG
jgi:hypothetical protein